MKPHTAIQTFRSLQLYIVSSLEEIILWQLPDSRKSARTILRTICQSDFIVLMVILEKVSSLMLPATKALQTVGLNVVIAMHTIGDLTKALTEMRCEEVFTKIFTAAENVANSFGIKIARPRIAQTSKYRGNSGGTDISTEGNYWLDVTRIMNLYNQ